MFSLVQVVVMAAIKLIFLLKGHRRAVELIVGKSGCGVTMRPSAAFHVPPRFFSCSACIPFPARKWIVLSSTGIFPLNPRSILRHQTLLELVRSLNFSSC